MMHHAKARRARAVVVSISIFVLVAAACSADGVGGPKATDVGAVQWRWRPPPPASVGMPAAGGNDVVATFSHLVVVSLTPTGAERWRTRRLGVRDDTPLLTPDLVVVPADDGVVALDRSTGNVRWDTRLGGTAAVPDPDDAVSTPVIAGSTVLACLSGGALVALDAHSGAVRWRAPLAGRSEGPPATDGQTVVATWDPEKGEGAGVAAFDVATGQRRWSAALRAGGVSAPAIVGQGRGAQVVVVDDDLAAKAFDVVSGRRRWATEVGSAGSPAVPPLPLAHGSVLVADRRSGLTLLDGDGRRRWTARAHAAAVQGGPVGPTGGGAYALPLYDGKVLVAGPHHGRTVIEAPGGLVSGVAVAPGGSLLVSSAQGNDNQLVAYGPPP